MQLPLQGACTLPSQNIAEALFALMKQGKLTVSWHGKSTLHSPQASLCICLQVALLEEDKPAGWTHVAAL